MRTKHEKTFGTPARALTNADRGRIKQAAHDYNVANRALPHLECSRVLTRCLI